MRLRPRHAFVFARQEQLCEAGRRKMYLPPPYLVSCLAPAAGLNYGPGDN